MTYLYVRPSLSRHCALPPDQQAQTHSSDVFRQERTPWPHQTTFSLKFLRYIWTEAQTILPELKAEECPMIKSDETGQTPKHIVRVLTCGIWISCRRCKVLIICSVQRRKTHVWSHCMQEGSAVVSLDCSESPIGGNERPYGIVMVILLGLYLWPDTRNYRYLLLASMSDNSDYASL